MISPGRRGSAALVAGLGVCFAAIHLQHGTLQHSLVVYLAGVVLPLACAFVIVSSAGWLYVSRFSDRSVRRIARWGTVGLFALLMVSAWTLGHEYARGSIGSHTVYLLANDATVGVLIGLIVGVYDARRIEGKHRLTEAVSRLEAERDRAEALFEHTPVPVMEYRVEGKDAVIEQVNPALETVFGYDAAELLGKSIDETLVSPGEVVRTEALVDRLLAGERIQTEMQRQTARGCREFLVTSTLVRFGEELRGFSVMIDVTDRNRRNQRLDVLNRVLRHDLRNAMNVVAGTAEQLLDGSGDVRAARRIHDRALGMARTADVARDIEELLRDTPLALEPIDLGSLLIERARIAERTFDDRGFRVRIERRDDAIVAAPHHLAAAIDHVIENAAVHNDVAVPRLDVTLSTVGTEAEIRFRDNGPGIAEREREVFDQKFETDLRHASGLGLWLVTWIVTDAGGSVQFDRIGEGEADDEAEKAAADGSGTEVIVRLPLAESVEGIDTTVETGSDGVSPD